MVTLPEVDKNNNISKAHRNKAQRSFQPVKAQRKMRNLIFLICEAQRNSGPQLGGQKGEAPPKQKFCPPPKLLSMPTQTPISLAAVLR